MCNVCMTVFPPDGPDGLVPHILEYHRGSAEADWIESFLDDEER